MRRRILVVDDDTLTQMLLARALESVGHDVVCCSEAPLALARISEEPFDLLVTDYMMPEMNGVDLVRASRQARKDLRCVIVTGLHDAQHAHAEEPDTAWLNKPIDLDALFAIVDNC